MSRALASSKSPSPRRQSVGRARISVLATDFAAHKGAEAYCYYANISVAAREFSPMSKTKHLDFRL